MPARKATMYRSLHGAPILAGVPVHVLLGIMALGVLVGVGGLVASRLVGLCGLLGTVAVWSVLAFVCGQDRVAVPIFLLRLRFRFPGAISSYARSYLRVLLVEDEEGSP